MIWGAINFVFELISQVIAGTTLYRVIMAGGPVVDLVATYTDADGELLVM